MRRPMVWPVVRQLPARVKNHNVVVVTAGIAFYGLLALVPTLIAVVSVYGLVNQGNEDQIREQIENAAGSLDDETRTFVTHQLTQITTSGGNLTALLLGIAVALFASSGGVQKLVATVSLAYEASETRPSWKLRAWAYVFTAGAIVVVVLMVTIVGVVPVVLDALDIGRLATTAVHLVNFPVFALLLAGGLTVLYRYGPDRSPRTPWRNPGALVATLVWVLFAVAFSLYSTYIGKMPASYGLLGTVAAVMIFLQLSALAVVIGAEWNATAEELARHDPATATPDPSPPPTTTNAGAAADDGAVARPIGFAKAVAGMITFYLVGRSIRRSKG